MKEQIQILDKTFKKSLSEAQIQKAVVQIAARITQDLSDKDPLFIAILNGAFMFASDLMKAIDFPAQISFVKLSSYTGTRSSGEAREILGLLESVEGRTVVLVEDIVDSGCTMQQMLKILRAQQPADIRIATLFLKPESLQVQLHVDYAAFCIPDDFVIGYGLDYNGYGRNLSAVYTVVE